MLTKLKITQLALLLFGLFAFTACGDDEPDPEMKDPISSFQFEISEANFLEVSFQNFSQNATSYEWDFGDGNTSTEEAPTHVYDAGGDYTVKLTASNGTTSRDSEKSLTITDPNSAIKSLTGETSKTWKLLRDVSNEEYPVMVGPNSEAEIWWALGLSDPLGARECMMEEEYIFNIDGTYTYDTKGSVFADYGIWNADVEGQCVDENDATAMTGPGGEDLSAWGSGTFSFDYDVANGTLTVSGLGAHIGLAKVASTAEVSTPVAEVTYNIMSIETDGAIDKMVLRTSLPAADGFWQFILVSYDNPADEPDLPGAAPTTAFLHTVDGKTVTFDNKSVNADSYSWDFGDGASSTEENPVHTYAEDGSYTVTLEATNANGTNTATNTVTISTGSVFSAETIFGDGTKVWKLAPQAAALAVGPGKGSGEWFATTADDVTARACTFDDTYTFGSDGSFVYDTNGDLWGEPYMEVDPAGCINESDLSDNAKAWGSGSHTFTLTEATADQPAFLTVTGTGAFIGLAKAKNGGEYAAGPPDVDGSVRYEVLSYLQNSAGETLQLTVDISEGEVGGAYWTFTLMAE